ncbi:(2E,6E)-farnesyl diphosphate synthase [Kutzneria viridogrisea]|uniref:Geranylgeranyl diphosphate synthase type I n=1 Tax=Kutzneria viridogrisea TaxID=47990 RepID=A0ABR6BUS9_9PSEU|nr:geranylgeranyl diphosphate synthase type I [Kutzneria viridogrisea]
MPQPIAAANRLVTPALRQAVDELDPAIGAVIGYHLGWNDAQGRPIQPQGGKAVRPSLALLSAEAVGARPQVALPGAVAVELVHNFSLLHDDVMDGDEQRRNRPTVWRQFGVPAAILAGDALLVLAMDVLGRAGVPAASRCLAEAVQSLISGQCLDLAFPRRQTVAVEECMTMAARKTGALIRCAARLGGLLGHARPDQVELLGRYGAHLGLAFQLVDDLLGIRGEPAVTGKPVMADLRERKKSVPVTVALNSGKDAGRALARLYAEDDDSEECLRAMAALIDVTGALAWTERQARHHVRSAEHCLGRLAPAPQAHAALYQLAHFVTGRNR